MSVTDDDTGVERIITRALCHFGITVQLSPALLHYIDLIARWNRVHNLTSAKDKKEIALRHIADSLAVVPQITSGEVLDVGTGAGLPGMVLALCRPTARVVLLDANRKRTAFCLQTVATLGLTNVSVIHHRIEAFPSVARERFDWALTRGYASLAQCWFAVRPVLQNEGKLLAMKGRWPTRELAELAELGENAQVISISVPGLAEARHLVTVQLDPYSGASEGEFRRTR